MALGKGAILKTAFETYTIVKQIGAGGSGEVYQAADSEGGVCAIKILDPSKAGATRLKRFRNEINFCTKNGHPNIVKVLGNGITPDGATFYIMPLFPGTLRTLLKTGIAPNRVLPLFGKMLDGVEAAHLSGVWHRDLKPENILADPSSDLLVIADFGIAHFEEEALLTAVETKQDDRLANFVYAAPEQKVRGQAVTSKADIYPLGLILAEMYTGQVPLGTGYRKITAVVPELAYLDPLVELMLSQDPQSRPSIDELKRELIGRQNEFISRQRLNALKSEVVPESNLDDPFIRNPIKIKSVDFQDEILHLVLSAEPPPNWIAAFRTPSSATFYMGHGPETFQFALNRAYVRVSPGIDVQTLLNYAKSYIESANQQYSELVERQHRSRIEREKQELRNAIQAEERRQKILSTLKL